MTRDELMEYLDTVLSQAADGPPEGPRPAGTFLLANPPAPLSGFRLVAPDGTTFYLAVLEAADFEEG
jgi:hypothetical protein